MTESACIIIIIDNHHGYTTSTLAAKIYLTVMGANYIWYKNVSSQLFWLGKHFMFQNGHGRNSNKKVVTPHSSELQNWNLTTEYTLVL